MFPIPGIQGWFSVEKVSSSDQFKLQDQNDIFRDFSWNGFEGKYQGKMKENLKEIAVCLKGR